MEYFAKVDERIATISSITYCQTTSTSYGHYVFSGDLFHLWIAKKYPVEKKLLTRSPEQIAGQTSSHKNYDFLYREA